jgi:TRAP-type C4-dicarboxylate transport system permease small subunit
VDIVKTFSAIVMLLSRCLFIVAGAALISSMLLTVSDVILRSFQRPITGTYELVGLLGALTVAFAMPQTSRLRGHVLMDFLTDRLGPVWKKVLHVFTRALAIALFIIIGWNMLAIGNDYWRLGEGSPTLQVPYYPFAYSIAVCCAVECLVLFFDIFKSEDAQS